MSKTNKQIADQRIKDELANLRRYYHEQADVAWESGDKREHAICCMQANSFVELLHLMRK